MKKIIKFLTVLIVISYQTNLIADVPYYIDFKYILNQSEAGKKAQQTLKNKLENGIKKIQVKEKSIQEEEKKVIAQKKIISADEYKKKVNELRKKVASIQKERNTLLNNVSKQRVKARNELLNILNPIIKDYMLEKKIKMVIDKKYLLLADNDLDITKDIISMLNKKLKTIKFN